MFQIRTIINIRPLQCNNILQYDIKAVGNVLVIFLWKLAQTKTKEGS